MKMKKGEIWISAVLYTAIGIVAMTLILAAGIPLINKIKDRNTFAQTKELMYVFDESIRTVISEGLGSQRELSPFNIQRGDLYINENSVNWSMKTTALIVEPSSSSNRIVKKEGTLDIWQDETNIRDEYNINLGGAYSNLKFSIISDHSNPYLGEYNILVKYSEITTDGTHMIELKIT